MNYEEAIEYIHSIPKFRRPLGNAQLARLLESAGDPQDKLKFIHIAGTNGKGSTAAMLAEILKRQGYRTGMFTSPFIEVFNERIQINNTLIGNDELAEYTARMKELMEKNEAYVSEFAFITAVAFLYFYEKKCDIVVLETGMGGRLDATNIISTPILSVLTSISLDHMQFLGDTIEEIAAEKCGIIKPGVPVVSYPNADVRAIIEKTAKENGSELVFAKTPEVCTDGFIYKGKKHGLSLKGEYQPKNAAVVIEAAELLNKYGLEISAENTEEGLKNTSWQARYEFLRDNLVIDGGHNIDGVRELVNSLKADGRRVLAVVAMMADKSVSECMNEIADCADEVYCTQINVPRCAKAWELAVAAGEKDSVTRIYENAAKATEDALKNAGDRLVCVCGSLYLAGEIRKIYKN
jgi:dihydrofolate synthase/folylpolyglutamate synthase